MIMTVVTVKVALVVALTVAVKTVQIAPMILPHMDPSAVIQPGMNMVLIVPHWKATIIGIAPVATALVIVAALMAALMVVAVMVVM